MNSYRALFVVFLAAVLVSCSWFRPHGIGLSITNQSGAPIKNLEVDFPGGSFGITSLAPGASLQRWFNPSSTTNLKVIFEDPSGKHTAMLQVLSAGQSGEMKLRFTGGGRVTAELKPLVAH